MTREQYEATIKTILETNTEMLKNAKTTEEALMIMEGQAFQLQSVTNAYMGQEVQR